MNRHIFIISVALTLSIFNLDCGVAHQTVHKTGHVAAHGMHKTAHVLHHAGEEIEEHTPE
jgi:hypothetical protein